MTHLFRLRAEEGSAHPPGAMVMDSGVVLPPVPGC